MLHKKYYKSIANIINTQLKKQRGHIYKYLDTYELLVALANFFQEDNPNFDQRKFFDACYYALNLEIKRR